MKGLIIVVVAVLSIAALIEVVAIGGAWLLHRQKRNR